MSVTFSLQNETALITGASRGLGSVIAQAFDAAGIRLALHYNHNKEATETLANSLHGDHHVVQGDLGNSQSVTQMFADATASLGKISILVNCAAAESQDVGDLRELSFERWQATQQANVDAPMLLTQLFSAQGIAGSIINISSIEGSRPAPGHSHYSTSKAALEMLTRASALELGGQGIRVNAIAPGLIHRDGIEDGWPEGVDAWRQAAPLGKLVTPESIASTALFLASEAAESITGTVITIDAGLSVRSGW